MRAGGKKGGEDFARCLAFSGGACGEEIGEPCIYCIFYQVCFDFKRQMLVNKHYFVAMLVNSQYLSLRFGFESAIWDRIWGGGLGLLCFVYFL